MPLDGSPLAERVWNRPWTSCGCGRVAVRCFESSKPPRNHRRVAEPTVPAGTGTRGGGRSVPGEDRRTASRGRHGSADAHCRPPHVAPAILEEAQTQRCVFIALATHGWGGLRRMLLGSVTDKVVRGLLCRYLRTGQLPKQLAGADGRCRLWKKRCQMGSKWRCQTPTVFGSPIAGNVGVRGGL